MTDPDQYDGFATPEELNLTPEEIQDLRQNKRQLTAYAQQKLRKLKAQQQTHELLNAAQGLWDKLAGMPDMLNFYWDNSYEIAAAFPFTGETKEDAKRLLGRKDLFGNFPIYKNKAEVKAAMKKQDEKDYGAF